MVARSVLVAVCVFALAGLVYLMMTREPWPGYTEQPAAAFSTAGYAQAKEAAAESGRMFVVHVGAEWCPPCKQMDATTWRDPMVMEWVAANAVASKVDSDAQPQVASDLGVQMLPTIIAFHGGRELGRLIGYRDAAEFVGWLNSMKPADLQPAALPSADVPAAPDAAAPPATPSEG